MLGKLIILAIAVVAGFGLFHKLAMRLGLVKPKPPATPQAREIGTSGFRLTKFNIVMMSLVGLYLLWGITQLLR
jgi:hypothetical protein